MSEVQKNVRASIQDALWAIGNGTCYAPECRFPVMVEVRPGVPRKNAQITHIFGIRPETPRYVEGLPDAERDAFKHLLLLCMPHHAEVDDRLTGETLYPAHELLKWKAQAEGGHKYILDQIGPVDEEQLMTAIADLFESPLKRLESIAGQLEKTGRLNERGLQELRWVLSVLSDNPVGPDPQTVALFREAAVRLLNSGQTFARSVDIFADAASRYAQATRYGSRFE